MPSATAATVAPPTSREIIFLLLRDRYRRNFTLPNYTPPGWYECDVFEITEAGYFREYEVKVSRADFRKDREKGEREYRVVGGSQPCAVHEMLPIVDGRSSCRRCGGRTERVLLQSKHGRLEAADPAGPARFWYVTPVGLIRPDELPKWAGLIEVGRRFGGSLIADEARAAPWIHRQRRPAAMAEQSRINCYWRVMDSFFHGRDRGVDGESHEWVI